jgi:hypothetical protein
MAIDKGDGNIIAATMEDQLIGKLGGKPIWVRNSQHGISMETHQNGELPSGNL